MKLKDKIIFKLINFWPPFLGAGIKVLFISEDFSEIRVALKSRFYNKNYLGTAYGGSIYSMVDPFYVLMLLQLLGKGYIVWDQAAVIKFLKPGKSDLFATFKISPEEVKRIKNELGSLNKIVPVFQVEIKNKEGELVALVDKTIYIRKKS